MLCFYDVETTGKIKFDLPSDDPTQPRIISVAGVLTDLDYKPIMLFHNLVKPDGWEVSEEITELTGLTMEQLEEKGMPISDALHPLFAAAEQATSLVAHNESFDRRMVRIELKKAGRLEEADAWKARTDGFCTMLKSTSICRVPKPDGKKGYKWPTLSEAYQHFTGVELEGAHDAMNDARACIEIHKGLAAAGVVMQKEVQSDPFA